MRMRTHDWRMAVLPARPAVPTIPSSPSDLRHDVALVGWDALGESRSDGGRRARRDPHHFDVDRAIGHASQHRVSGHAEQS